MGKAKDALDEDQFIRSPKTPVETQESVAESVRKVYSPQGKIDLARKADVDMNVIGSAQELGVEDMLQAAHASKNKSFKEVDRALKEMPKSGLRRQEEENMKLVGQTVSDLFDEIGSKPMSEVDVSVANKLDVLRGQTLSKEKVVWDKVRGSVPKGHRVDNSNLKELFKERLSRVENISEPW